MQTTDKIRQWIKDNFKGGLIHEKELAAIAESLNDLIEALLEMQKDGELAIVTHYSCPEFHSMGEGKITNGHCPECDYTYPLHQIIVNIYLKPLAAPTTIAELQTRLKTAQDELKQARKDYDNQRTEAWNKFYRLEDEINTIVSQIVSIANR